MTLNLKNSVYQFKSSFEGNYKSIFNLINLATKSQVKFSKTLNIHLILILVLISLIPKSYSVILNNKNNEDSLKEFNLAFKKFIDDWKIKNPEFNLSNINITEMSSFNAELRKRREINLEEELEYVLKNRDKNPKNLFNFERKAKSSEQSSNEFNSLEDRSLEEYQPKKCMNCNPHDVLRKHRLEQIKQEILRKLKLSKPPTVNISSSSRELILKSFQKNDPNYQNDQGDFIDDDEDVRIKQIITFRKNGNF